MQLLGFKEHERHIGEQAMHVFPIDIVPMGHEIRQEPR